MVGWDRGVSEWGRVVLVWVRWGRELLVKGVGSVMLSGLCGWSLVGRVRVWLVWCCCWGVPAVEFPGVVGGGCWCGRLDGWWSGCVFAVVGSPCGVLGVVGIVWVLLCGRSWCMKVLKWWVVGWQL